MNNQKKILKGFYCHVFSHDIPDQDIEDMELMNNIYLSCCKRCLGDIKIWKDYDCKDGEYWEKEI
jgi:hypothetical protein